MVIKVNPDIETVVQELVATGGFADADDVIEQAVLQLRARSQRERIRQSLVDGLAAVNRGEGIEATPEFWASVDSQIEARERAGIPIRPDVLP